MHHQGSDQRRTALRMVLGTLGAIAMVLGLTLVVATIANLLGGRDSDNVGGSIGALVLFLGITAGGFVVVRANFWSRSAINTLEARVLALAETMGGELTVDTTAAHCGLGVVESKAVLDRLVMESGAQLQVTDDGVLVYSFPGLVERKRQPSPPN